MAPRVSCFLVNLSLAFLVIIFLSGLPAVVSGIDPRVSTCTVAAAVRRG